MQVNQTNIRNHSVDNVRTQNDRVQQPAQIHPQNNVFSSNQRAQGLSRPINSEPELHKQRIFNQVKSKIYTSNSLLSKLRNNPVNTLQAFLQRVECQVKVPENLPENELHQFLLNELCTYLTTDRGSSGAQEASAGNAPRTNPRNRQVSTAVDQRMSLDVDNHQNTVNSTNSINGNQQNGTAILAQTSPTLIRIPMNPMNVINVESQDCIEKVNPQLNPPLQKQQNSNNAKTQPLSSERPQLLINDKINKCMSTNAKMKRFMCAQCQLLYIDPLQIPVQTVLRPFLVHQAQDNDATLRDTKNPALPKECCKKFTITKQLLDQIKQQSRIQNVDNAKNTPKLLIQLRCIRMNNKDGLLSQNFPQFGFYRVNLDNRKLAHLKIAEPPNDKKRHDKFYDLTDILKNGENSLEIVQIFKNDKDPFKYACGIFIVRNFEQQELVNYVKNLQPVIPFQEGLSLIKKRFEKPECLTNQEDLKCQFTQKKIIIPVKGQWCEHDLCFDLENYIGMNQNPTSRKWICPCQPSDKPVILRRDEFTMKLLEIAKPDEDVLHITENLEIKFKDNRLYKIQGNKFVLDGQDSSIQGPEAAEQNENFSSLGDLQPQSQTPQAIEQINRNVDSSIIEESKEEFLVPQQFPVHNSHENAMLGKRKRMNDQQLQQSKSIELRNPNDKTVNGTVNGYQDFQIDLDCSDNSEPQQNKFLKNGLYNIQSEPNKRIQSTFQGQMYQHHNNQIRPHQQGMIPPAFHQNMMNQQQYNQNYAYAQQVVPIQQHIYNGNQAQISPQSVYVMSGDQSYYGMQPSHMQTSGIMPQNGYYSQANLDLVKQQMLHTQQKEFQDMFQTQNQQEVSKQTTLRMKDIVPTNQPTQKGNSLKNTILSKNPQISSMYDQNGQYINHQGQTQSKNNALNDVAKNMINGKEKNMMVQNHINNTATIKSQINNSSVNNMHQTGMGQAQGKTELKMAGTKPINSMATTQQSPKQQISGSNQSQIINSGSGSSKLPSSLTTTTNISNLSIPQVQSPHQQQKAGQFELIEIDD
ncbi:miz zinc finger family protein [Stylonychia lemnae]|uniref:Miz zinc finger family protein n=1 Tax=Stylonychia lemnae TaxID=5949 RepID=A0A078ALC7_STYLE|nr:miz zinc finger family protein [Stylonychia lemnae]|eukprot:CDW83014.1 miz zinc finger family protein [Stylonychia lemnae]